MESLEVSNYRSRLWAISIACLVGAALMGAKFYVYWLTNSTAFLSDALESIINVVASAFAVGSVMLAAKPPDETHPYGHGKIEYFSAGFEGALIFLAAIGIFWEAWPQIFHPRSLPNLGSGLLISLLISLVNLILGLSLLRIGKRTQSLILVADGKHVLTDVYTSGGVVLGMVLVWWTNWLWLDGAVACLVGLNIIYTGSHLMYQSFAGLMDASNPELLEDICNILREHRKDLWIDVHQLRARRYGNRVHIDFHLILPREFSLEDGHTEVKELEKIFSDYYHGLADVQIHVDPCIDPECSTCVNGICQLRQEETKQQSIWQKEVLVEPPLNRNAAGEDYNNAGGNVKITGGV